MQLIGKIESSVQRIWHTFQECKSRKNRIYFEKLLRSIPDHYDNVFSGTVLVDAIWDNPNYWLRYSIVRAALGLLSARQVGILGPFRRRQQNKTLKRFAIEESYDFTDFSEFSDRNYSLAQDLCNSGRNQEDILTWELPYNVPVSFLYDFILKRQRSAFVHTKDKSFVTLTHLFLNYISVAEKLMQYYEPILIISSHAIGINLPLVWIALQHRIKVVVPFGDVGCFRFWKLNQPSEVCDFTDRPKIEDLRSLTLEQQNALSKTGEEALRDRISGRTESLGAIYAYNMRHTYVNKNSICSQFRWDAGKKIIAVYASNWFDYPHSLGMKHFQNFYDWITSVLRKASDNTEVNWIFKAHPADDCYGGITLSDLVKLGQFRHIKLAPQDWKGADMLNAIDAFVTYHGTVGIEATILRKPVLVADNGWYDDWGFVRAPKSREDFLELLGTRWWEDMDVKGNSRLAKIFAGWYWGRPEWQKNFVLEDDSRQWEIYKTAPDLIKNNMDIIEKEISMVREWFNSSHPHFHTYKMMQTDKYIV